MALTDLSDNAQQAVNDWQPEPVIIDGCDTFAKLFRRNCAARGNAIALREKQLGIWQSYSWTEYYQRAVQTGCSLLALNLQPGDVAAIISEDNKEWIFSDLGIQCAGGICHGIYPTSQTSQLAYQLNDSRARYLFVENEEQLDKFLACEAQLQCIEKVIVYDMEGLRRFSHEKVISWDAFLAIAADSARLGELQQKFEHRIDQTRAEDIALLIYTSGTTGMPKGAQISNRYLLAQANNYPQLPFGPGDEILTFLPLCHAAERIFSLAIPVRYGITINFVESGETFAQDLQEVAPSAIFAVPRVWEKLYSRISIIMQDATGFGRKAYQLALNISQRRLNLAAEGKSIPFWLSLSHRILDWTVLRNIRVLLGVNRTHAILSGAAPISHNLLNWLNALGLTVYEAYGQTETGIVTVTKPGQSPIGSVGRPMHGVELQIADSGEILLRSASNFSGYLNQTKKTAETVINGWVHSGDVGRLDEQGNLYIMERLKDIIITAGGKNITPSLLENELKFSPFISDAVIIGDRRKYLTALIMIDQENVENYAQEQRIPFTDYKSLCKSEPVQQMISQQIEVVNAGFSPVEQIKKFRLIDVLLSAEDEELTPTMKLKRREVERKYAALIDSMY